MDEEAAVDFPSDEESDYTEVASEMEDTVSDTDDDSQYDGTEATYEQYIGKDGTLWNSVPLATRRTPAAFRNPVTKVRLPPGYHIDSPVDCFSLFFDNTVIDIIVKYTNLEAIRILGDSWKHTNSAEIHAFIGLLLIAGLNSQENVDYTEFWDKLYGNPIFRATMGITRFKKILRFIRFDDKNTRTLRREKDKLAPIRDVWNIINKNFLKYYSPGENLTVDEQLVPYRGRVPFKQYIPSKPDKYGMKIWWIVDSVTYYPLKGIPYLGKEGNTRAENLAQHVVEALCEPFFGTHRNITFDNFFTSYELVHSLLSKGLTSVGTLRKNKKCIPPSFLPHPSRAVESTMFGFRHTVSLISYVPKKSRCVLFLSTKHHTTSIAVDNKNKSVVNLFYNKTKGGVDTLDKLCHAYTVRRKTNRWPMAYFQNLIDVGGIAAFVIWNYVYPDWNSKKPRSKRKLFIREIVTDLVKPHILARSKKGITASHISVMNEILNDTSEKNRASCSSAPAVKRKRCYLCPSKISRMSKQYCDSCNKNVCSEHSEKKIKCNECNK